jgi:osmoprotectant transport system ATP-binding protein
VIEFREVSKVYAGSGEPVVKDLSFEVPEGEICVLVGPSGCGKTTTMRMINRLVDLTSGDILLGGDSVASISATRLRREIGYAIQGIGLFPHRTIVDNIGTVPRLLGWTRERIRTRADELLDLVGLDSEQYRDRYPAELSGGQQQRIGVARAMAADPPAILMDEPFGAVDPITRTRLQDEFLRIQQEIKKTIVFVTHDIDEAIKMGDRIAILEGGGVLAQYDTPGKVLSEPASDFVASFVGADRVLKHLSLVRVGDVELDPANGKAGDKSLPRMSESVSLRDALSELIGSGAEKALVLSGGERGEVRGAITLDGIRQLNRRRGG